MHDSNGLRVIVLDDEPSDRALMVGVLQQAGVPVSGAFNELFELLGELRESPSPDVVLADLNLPDSRGVETVRILRAVHPDLPIVVVTGDPDAARGALAAGADEVVLKDQADRDLSAAIQRTVQRNAGLTGAKASAFYLADAPLVVVEPDDSIGLMNAAAARLLGPADTNSTLTMHFVAEDRVEVARFLVDLREAEGERVWSTARLNTGVDPPPECVMSGRLNVRTRRAHLTLSVEP